MLVVASAQAHDADVIYVSARAEAAPGAALVELVTLTGAALGQLAPVDADADGLLSQADLDARAGAIAAGVWDDMPLTAGGVGCPREAATATLREGYVELTATFRCGPGELSQDFRILRILPANFRVVLGSQVEGEAGKAFAQGTLTTLKLPRPPPPGAFSRAAFDQGVGEGLGAVLWLGGLAALAVVLGASATWRRGLLAVLLSVGGIAAGAFVHAPEWTAGLVLAGLAVGVALAGKAHPALGAAVGLALAVRVGGGSWSSSVGIALGAAGAAAALGVASVAAGRLLQRRPPAWRLARWLAAAAVCFAVGFRVAAPA